MQVQPTLQAVSTGQTAPKPAPGQPETPGAGEAKPAEVTKPPAPPAKPASGLSPAPTPLKKGAAAPAETVASTSSHGTWPDPSTKEALVQRLLQGEQAQALAQETGIPAQRIEAWRDAYLKDGKQGLLQ
jgi:hypothetical protein